MFKIKPFIAFLICLTISLTTIHAQAPGGVITGLDVWLKANNGVTGAAPITAWTNQFAAGSPITLNGLPNLNNISTGYNYNPFVDFAAPIAPRQFLSLTGLNGVAGKDYNGFFFVSQLNDLSRINTHIATAAGVTIAGPVNGCLHGEVVGVTAAINQSVYDPSDFGLGSPVGTWQRNATNIASNAVHINSKHILSASSIGSTTTNRLLGGQDDGGGGFVGHPRDYKGFVSEVITYSTAISAIQRQKIHSYLGIKYGITLSSNYLSTSGTNIYNTSLPYDNNIIGIGRDDAEALIQKQSHNNDDTIRIYKSSLVGTNLINAGTFGSDISYLVTGATTAKMCYTTSEMPVSCGLFSRLEREWKVTNTNYAETFNMDFKLSSCALTASINPSDYRLLVDDDGDFSNGGTSCYANGDGTGLVISFSSSVVTVTNISNTHIPNNNTKYITIAYTLTPPPDCGAGLIYSLNLAGTIIQNYDPNLPISGLNPINNNIVLPINAKGLTVSPNINGGLTSPTFYTTVGGIYYWWNQIGWTNTGHSIGNPSATNIAGGGGFIYSLNGTTGDVYKYNGSGPATLLITIPGYVSSGPADLAVDNSGNFYVLTTNGPQALTAYNSSGAVLCTYNLSGYPLLGGGNSFAIVGNKIHVQNAVSYHIGTVSGSTINFTTSIAPFLNTDDYASCPFNDLGNVIISNTGPIACNNPTVNAIATTTIIPANYNWTGTGITAGLGTNSISLNLPGIYTCTVSTPSSFGCPVVVTTSVNLVGVVPIIINPTSATLCIGSAGTTISANGFSSYIWSPATGLSTTSGSIVIASPVTSTIYTVIGGIGTCTNSATFTIIAIPAIPGTITSNTAICIGESTQINANGGTTYTWNPSYGLNFTNINSPIATPSISTIYTVQISQSGSCTDTKTVSVTVNPLPTVYAGSDLIIQYGDSVLLNGTGTGTLTWISGDNLGCSNCPSTYAIPFNNSCYILEAISGNGCKNTDVICVQVIKDLIVAIPNVITPNGDNINDFFKIQGIEQYPNSSLIIFDRWGIKVYENSNYKNEWNADGNNDGTYYYILNIATDKKYNGFISVFHGK